MDVTASSSPEPIRQLIERLIKARRWFNGTISHFVTDDDGSGAFIRGTGTELAGFDQARTQADDALAEAIALLRSGGVPSGEALIEEVDGHAKAAKLHAEIQHELMNPASQAYFEGQASAFTFVLERLRSGGVLPQQNTEDERTEEKR